MHELSIVSSVVDLVIESLEKHPGARVVEVRLRLGALAAAVEDSLQFCYELATRETPLEGSRLVVKIEPVVVHCAACSRNGELESLQSFRCPHCGEPAADVEAIESQLLDPEGSSLQL
jgi:hydrogenase nickel incorporation protein HypA/HybF